MDYLKFYELEIEPFRNDPEPKFFFEGRAQRNARMRILRGVRQRKGLAVLVGGPGLGKTTLARHLLLSLDDANTCVRLIQVPHRACDTGWLLPRIAVAFGVTQPGATALAVLGQVFERLSMLVSAGRSPVLLVDEAQLLENAQVMEEFRALLNLEDQERKLLSLVLFGLPELDRVLRLDLPLAQRIDVRAQMTGLEADEVGPYLEHRLKLAGRRGDLFTEDAVQAFYGWTCGIPRLVNTLADNALFEGALACAREIDLEVLRLAAEQLSLLPAPEPEPAPAPIAEPVPQPRPVAASAASGRADWVMPLAPEPGDFAAARTRAPRPAPAPAPTPAPAPRAPEVAQPPTPRAQPAARPQPAPAPPRARTALPRPAPIEFEAPIAEPHVDTEKSQYLFPEGDSAESSEGEAEASAGVSLPEVTEQYEPIPLAAPVARAPAAPSVPLEVESDDAFADEIALETTGSDDELPFLDPEPSSDTPRESLADLLSDELDEGPEPRTEPSLGSQPPRPAAAPAPAAAKPMPKPQDASDDEFLLDALFDEIQVRR